MISIRRRSTSYPTPGVPTVNLLPEAAREKVALRHLHRRLAAATIATVGIMVGVLASQQGLILAALHDRSQAQAEHDKLRAEHTKLAPVAAYYAGVQANQEALARVMSKEALHSQIVSHLHNAAGRQITITNISIAITTTAGASGTETANPTARSVAACPAPNPFAAADVVGCATLTGVAATRDAIGRFLDTVTADDRFANAFVSSTTVGTSGVTFNASVGLTSAVYSNRYADPDFIKGAK